MKSSSSGTATLKRPGAPSSAPTSSVPSSGAAQRSSSDGSAPTSKATLHTLANREKRMSRILPPASQLSSEQEVAMKTFVEQGMQMLHYQKVWEELISKDPERALAFTRKACKLLRDGVEMVSQIQKKSQHNQEWACCLVQSHYRTRVAMKAYREHLYRTKVAMEMVQTERSYMRAMGVALSLYRVEAEKVLQKKDLNVIFGNLENLRALNIPFWRELENRVRLWNVETALGDLFTQKLKTVLNEYLIYVKGYDHALKLHDTLLLSKEGKKYAQTMARCIEDTMAQNLPLGAYLILPVQRFPRYKLLLVDLIKHTSKTHPDRAALDAALKEVDAMCAAINNATRNSDAFVELQRLDSMLESGSGIKLTDKPNRMLKADVPIQEQVAEGTKSKWKDRSVLVFDDMLVCVTKKANKPEGWHVEWRALGQAVHLPSSDPNVSSFELVEYKRISEAPYSQCVKHTLKPVDAAHSVSYWIDTMRNFQTLISVPGIMSDAHQWLTSNLITQAEWDVLLRKSGTLSKFNRLSKPVVLEAQQSLNSIYTVVEGEVTEILHVGKHIHLPLRTLTGATDRYFGGGGLLRGSKSPFEVRATSKEVVVASLPYKDLVSILAADPHFHHRFWIYVCVVLTEQFHAWELPKILEKHYLGLRGPRDFAARSDLSALFAAASMAPGAQTPAQDLCSLLQLSPVEKIQAAWHHCTLQILQPVRAEIRGTFYVLETCVAVVGHLFGRIQIEMIPLSLISRVGSSGALSIEVVYTRPQMQQSVSAQLVVPPASLSSSGGGKKPIDSMNEALAKFRSSSDSRPAAQGTSASSRFFDPRLELSDKQWDNLFAACAKVHSFKAGEVILEMGKSMSKLYQIVTNRCRVMVEVEVVKGSETTREIQHVNYLDTGSIFGEVMYLYGGSATATIVADNDGTEVYILDRVSLERHLFHAPELAGPFYKAIASSLDDRLQARNERVLRAYSLFLAQKIKAGDIEMEQLLGTTTTESTSGGVPVIGGVGQPQPPKKEPVRIVRKESIGVIKRPGDI